MLPISDVDKVKPMLLPHGGWPMAAGPASRLGSIEPGDKTGLRLSPHLAPSTSTKLGLSARSAFEKVVRARSTYRSTDSYYRRI